ncbi:MBL fold metallo-hydrolase [Haloglomus litoreum]|uniref:MBL fold metallo-hydrolase n=1 Tax=Haloglomus litoreum TaxID=3034026 RepID=UPI0023E7A68B|nr:MBL fold metallo-hydrolase [Haloglomus sp. DT116]
MDDVHRIEIPTPFDVGRVNCYAFVADGLSLLDPGPATEAAYAELSAGLNDLGFTVADVEQVLITHPHMDHFGIAARVIKESGGRAVAHRDAMRPLAEPLDHFDREQAFFRPFLQSMGVPEQVAETAVTLPEAYTDYQEPLAVDYEVRDGDSVDVGVDLTAVHSPGHAPGSVCFVPETAPVAFTGDHVLQHISPNPLLTVAPGTEDERTRSLPDYLDSLERLRAADADTGYGGHGERIEDLDVRIGDIIDHHRQREERIANLIGELGPVTAYDLMQELFPDLPATEVFPGMSEVIGHLDLLEDENRVEIIEEEAIRKYALR